MQKEFERDLSCDFSLTSENQIDIYRTLYFGNKRLYNITYIPHIKIFTYLVADKTVVDE